MNNNNNISEYMPTFIMRLCSPYSEPLQIRIPQFLSHQYIYRTYPFNNLTATMHK